MRKAMTEGNEWKAKKKAVKVDNGRRQLRKALAEGNELRAKKEGSCRRQWWKADAEGTDGRQ